MREEYLKAPKLLKDTSYRADSFANGEVLLNKKKGKLPPMGWNSWNAFGSGNTEALTKMMADRITDLGLDKLGYSYVVLDDGCYKPERVDGRLSNEEVKFPGGFKNLADYIHEKGLKFGMYNDIGTNLCAGAAVGTCGHEDDDAKSYIEWDVDFLKVDNCYYLWDNATFSDAANAKYVFAPAIRTVDITTACRTLKITSDIECTNRMTLSVKENSAFTGNGVEIAEDCAIHIGTFDGTGPGPSPLGAQSGELCFEIESEGVNECEIRIEYASGEEEGIGRWLQVAINSEEGTEYFFDEMLPETQDKNTFTWSAPISVRLNSGTNLLRLMNHRRQENTLGSYAALLEELNKAKPDHDILLSICEWGKTSPQNWGYKVGDYWRILNDITFRVGSDGNPGHGSWVDGYTPSVTSQYNKAVIMDEFSGLEKGYNDPDMLMVGMEGLTPAMNRTHMAMWCMMNAPLMLGLDLRRVKKNDELFEIIGNDELISFNQDSLGIQAKRVYCSKAVGEPDKEYVRDNERVDILAKPLADGGLAISFINLSETKESSPVSISIDEIVRKLEKVFGGVRGMLAAKSYRMTDVWTGDRTSDSDGIFEVRSLGPCENMTYRVTPIYE